MSLKDELRGFLSSLAYAAAAFVLPILGVPAWAATLGSAVISGYVGKEVAEYEAEKAAAEARGLLLNKVSNDAPIPVVYGLRKVGGTRVLMESSGSDNQFLHVVIAMSEGEVNSFENVYLNDVLSTDSRFSGVLNVYKHTGSTTQTADANLVADVAAWTTDHRLQGTAYVYARMKYDEDAYSAGLPTITADIKGVKVYDPRTSTTAWSDNPALCIRDYLTNDRYGRGISASLIDDASINAAANYCEESVTIGGVSKDRFTCNGVVDTSMGSMEVLKRLLTSCRGFLIFSGGKYKLVIDKAETANFTFSEDNIVGQWSINLGNKRNQFNRIRANFFNPNRQWQNDLAVVDSSTLRTQDNGVLLEKMIDLPFTSDIDRAKMITTININQSRQQISCDFTATIEALRAEVGDVVYIKHATTGWDSLNGGLGKKFRVMRLSLQNDDEVRVSALEYDENAFDFGTIAVSDTSPNTNLPDVTTASAPIGLTITEELYVTNTSQGAQVRANLSWTKPADAFVTHYEVEYQNGANGFEFVTTTRQTSAQINNLSSGDYTFRVRAVNTVGVRSEYITVSHGMVGITEAPAQITNFSVRAIDGSAHLQWDRATDLDVIHGGYLRIRHSSLTAGATWANASDIGEALAGTATSAVLPLLAGSYMIKAIDSAGNLSENAALSVTTTPNLENFNAVATVTESPLFTGTKSNCEVEDSVLQLVGDVIETPRFLLLENDDFLELENGDLLIREVGDISGNNIATNGTYNFANSLDLGAVFTSRVSANVTASGYVSTDLFDDRETLIDNWASFDGESSDKIGVKVELRLTEDDPSSSPTWSEWQPLIVGDYKARGMEFRLVFNSQDSSLNIDISQLSVYVDMPDRNERGSATSSTSGTITVNYNKAFKATPHLGVTANNLDDSQYWTITNESDSGFDIVIHDNNSNTDIAKDFNWMATGYGRVA